MRSWDLSASKTKQMGRLCTLWSAPPPPLPPVPLTVDGLRGGRADWVTTGAGKGRVSERSYLDAAEAFLHKYAEGGEECARAVGAMGGAGVGAVVEEEEAGEEDQSEDASGLLKPPSDLFVFFPGTPVAPANRHL